jgi:HlyD family secretion protein
MEIELDLLSTDAVRVPSDARAGIERWGGDGILEARLRRIEPAAFTRISALGIEEQRVRLRLDLLSKPQDRPGLGDGFRVQVRLIVWDAESLLQLPRAALFRQGEGWAVFVAVEGKARLRPVTIGRQTDEQAEVLEGLTEGDRVLIYPDSAMADGTAIQARQN